MPKPAKPNETSPPPPVHLIQPWHVVLGDTSCRNQRTTAATAVLRQIKREARTKYFGQKKERWVPLAAQELQQRLAAMPEFVSCNDPNDVGRVLIKCTPKALNSGRVAEPFLYGYAGDEQAWYGTAQMPVALEFFLTSRDGPQLSTELSKHQENLNALLQENGSSSNNPHLQQFGETLQFFQTQLTKADQGNVLAAKLLESLKPINALKEQWKLVQKHQAEAVTHRESIIAIVTDAADTTAIATTASPTETSSIVSEEQNDQDSEAVPIDFPTPTKTGDMMVAVPFVDHSDVEEPHQLSKHFYPVCDLPPLDASGSEDENESPTETDPLLWQEAMDLDKLDVDGFMADLELADDDDILLQDTGVPAATNNAMMQPTDAMPATGRRNRSDSECSHDHSVTSKPRIKRSRKAGVTSAVAALATLATFVAVNTPSSGPAWPADMPASGDIHPSAASRLLQQQRQAGLPTDDFEWEGQQKRQEQQQQDDDWCKSEEHSPFGSFAGVGDFLCSLDLGSRFGLSDKEDEEDDFVDYNMDTLSV